LLVGLGLVRLWAVAPQGCRGCFRRGVLLAGDCRRRQEERAAPERV